MLWDQHIISLFPISSGEHFGQYASLSNFFLLPKNLALIYRGSFFYGGHFSSRGFCKFLRKWHFFYGQKGHFSTSNNDRGSFFAVEKWPPVIIRWGSLFVFTPEAPRRTTVLPRMPARSPQASYVLIGPLSFLAFLWSSYTFLTFCQVFLRMKHGRRETMDHVCTREGLLTRNNHCIMTLRR